MTRDRWTFTTTARPSVPRCDGSGRPGLDGRMVGDTDRCGTCTRDHVRVLADGTLAAHAPGKGVR